MAAFEKDRARPNDRAPMKSLEPGDLRNPPALVVAIVNVSSSIARARANDNPAVEETNVLALPKQTVGGADDVIF
jgi:hypothetical protein